MVCYPSFMNKKDQTFLAQSSLTISNLWLVCVFNGESSYIATDHVYNHPNAATLAAIVHRKLLISEGNFDSDADAEEACYVIRMSEYLERNDL